MTKFIPGLKLSKLYFEQAIKPILDKNFPNLKYAAAVLGWGSEALGFDTAISTDHHWGPKVVLFLSDKDNLKYKEKIDSALSTSLPYEFMGYSTSFGKPQPNGVRISIKKHSGLVDHMVLIHTTKDFYKARLGVDLSKKLTVFDWLTIPQQRLVAISKGAVYFDSSGELTKTRQQFNYYPHEVWLYLLAAQWSRISMRDSYLGRTGDVGDELGSKIIAARLVREVMRLCFLMEKEYQPYSKWFGTAFSKLIIARRLSPILHKVLQAQGWKEREKWMSKAYAMIAEKHNELKITKPVPTKVSSYHGRPYLVIHADTIAAIIQKEIKDKQLKKLDITTGSVDQLIDNPSINENLSLSRSLGIVYK